MIKLTIELKDEKFFFEYQLGGVTRQHSEMTLCEDNLFLFSKIIDNCHKVWNQFQDRKHDMRLGQWYLEEHPELIEEYIKKRGLDKKNENKEDV